jgi:hypothetical protein
MAKLRPAVLRHFVNIRPNMTSLLLISFQEEPESGPNRLGVGRRHDMTTLPVSQLSKYYGSSKFDPYQRLFGVRLVYNL